ncbi:hypothetical protein J2T19_004125 [Paenibacillus tundrae]|uniref:Uncharacterized protein n=1 Tax=Paenibacillus tundrae TaxID=528187 RepID=A0ABT9WIL9_9BACL|nr:hypothetical protein [Paenibacillus tundrae]
MHVKTTEVVFFFLISDRFGLDVSQIWSELTSKRQNAQPKLYVEGFRMRIFFENVP